MKTYILEGLNCPTCAGKIECKLREDQSLKDVCLNFPMKTLRIDGGNTSYIQDIVDSVEDGVSVIEKKKNEKVLNHEDEHLSHHGHSHHRGLDESIMNDLIPIFISSALIIVAFLLDNFYLKLSVFFIAYFVVGGEVLLRAVKNIIKGEVFDENFLMAIATIGAFALGEYLEAVAVMLFYQLGEFVQDLAVDKSRNSIAKLMDIRPDYANLLLDGDIKRVSPEKVGIGDIILVKAGEKIPLDGLVVEGLADLDTSSLSGESLPRTVNPGDTVLSGSVNMSGKLKIRVEKDFADSTVSKIMDMVENASSKKAKTEKFISAFARYYTPAVVALALLIAFLPPLILSTYNFSFWIRRGLIFLVVSCPCALVISVPLSYFGGIGCASRNGILIKGGNYLESLAKVNTVVFDKTGTITKGKLEIKEINSLEDENSFMDKLKKLESLSNHPIAKCILGDEKLMSEEVKNYKEFAGFGIYGEINGLSYFAGNAKLMKRESIDFKESGSLGTVLYLAENSKYIGHIILADDIKENSKKAIQSLKKAGIDTVMLSGDNHELVSDVARKLGINDFHASLLPHEKVEKLEGYINESSRTIFVGDGINDAPSLARADIGFAMGGVGSDAAMEASDIILMKDDVLSVLDSISIAKKTKIIVWENIIFALGIKVLIMVLASFGLANMWGAIFGDVGVALIAVFNSIRVVGYRPQN